MIPTLMMALFANKANPAQKVEQKQHRLITNPTMVDDRAVLSLCGVITKYRHLPRGSLKPRSPLRQAINSEAVALGLRRNEKILGVSSFAALDSFFSDELLDTHVELRGEAHA